MQGEAPWMYITLYSFLFTFTFLNTSSPPPSISLPLFTWLFQYSGFLYSNSYCGLIMFYWTLQLKTTPQSWGILLPPSTTSVGLLLLHTSWFLFSFLLYQCSGLVSISFLNFSPQGSRFLCEVSPSKSGHLQSFTLVVNNYLVIPIMLYCQSVSLSICQSVIL